jgi:CHAD domain-containing protein
MGKPWPVLGLHPDMPVHQSLEQIIKARLQELFSQYDAVMNGGDAEAIHQARVSIRRIQTVGKIFPGHFHVKRLEKIVEHLRAFHRALGSVRTIDVAIERLERRITSVQHADPRAAFLLAGQLNVRRQETFRNMKREWKGLSRRLIEEKLLAALRSPKKKKGKSFLSAPFRETVAGVYPDVAGAFMTSYKSILAHPNAAKGFHTARLKGKRLRYLMEFCTQFSPQAFTEVLDDLKDTLRSFGEIHDIDLQIELFRSTRKEIARYNKRVHASQKLSVDVFAAIAANDREERAVLFEKLRTSYTRWQEHSVLTHAISREPLVSS